MSLRWSTRFRLIRHISRNLQRLSEWARVDPNGVRDSLLGRTRPRNPQAAGAIVIAYPGEWDGGG